MNETLVILVCRLVVGGVLVLASSEKLLHRGTFRGILAESYGVRSPLVAGSVSLAIPAFELVLGCLLLVGVYLSVVAWATAALLLILAGAAVFLLKEGSDCGCGLGAASAGRQWILGRNLALIAVTMSIPFLSGSDGPFSVLALALPVLAMASLALTAIRPDGESSRHAGDGVTRRSFLQILGGGTGLAFSAAFASSRSAEAACYGCNTCSPEMVLYQCGDGCCTYLVRDREYCTSGCSPCSGWRLVTYC